MLTTMIAMHRLSEDDGRPLIVETVGCVCTISVTLSCESEGSRKSGVEYQQTKPHVLGGKDAKTDQDTNKDTKFASCIK